MNVICRRLAHHPTARLLVTAPTNRAVTVLAERFLGVVDKVVGGKGDSKGLSGRCNAVLVGVEDKLVAPAAADETEGPSEGTLSSRLRGIFAYTWVESVKKELVALRESLKRRCQATRQAEACGASIDPLIARAERLTTKLSMSIPSKRTVAGSAKLFLQQLRQTAAAEAWEDSLENNDVNGSTDASTAQLETAIERADDLVDALDDMKSVAPVEELLATARVIFCTLSTAGAAILKRTRGVDDLLVDEAAAATEPEICIPFHLRPKRLLAVGDREWSGRMRVRLCKRTDGRALTCSLCRFSFGACSSPTASDDHEPPRGGHGLGHVAARAVDEQVRKILLHVGPPVPHEAADQRFPLQPILWWTHNEREECYLVRRISLFGPLTTFAVRLVSVWWRSLK